jgi:5-methyltetrahydropteroyltriglutamate--homocysteine methyltransferase
VLKNEHIGSDQRVSVGVLDVVDPRVEPPAEIRDRVIEAAEFIRFGQLGSTDDCGFAPFSADPSRSRETAFAKIRARVDGTQLAARALGVE